MTRGIRQFNASFNRLVDNGILGDEHGSKWLNASLTGLACQVDCQAKDLFVRGGHLILVA
jgi:hypothetical protein